MAMPKKNDAHQQWMDAAARFDTVLQGYTSGKIFKKAQAINIKQMSDVLKKLEKNKPVILNIFGNPKSQFVLNNLSVSEQNEQNEYNKHMKKHLLYSHEQDKAECLALVIEWTSPGIQKCDKKSRASKMKDYNKSSSTKDQASLKESFKKASSSSPPPVSSSSEHNTHVIGICHNDSWLHVFDPNWGEFRKKLSKDGFMNGTISRVLESCGYKTLIPIALMAERK